MHSPQPSHRSAICLAAFFREATVSASVMEVEPCEPVEASWGWAAERATNHCPALSAEAHKCSASCQFVHLFGNLFRCASSCQVHVCDMNCDQKVPCAPHYMRCRVSGKVFPVPGGAAVRLSR